jgi:hypothetical protein
MGKMKNRNELLETPQVILPLIISTLYSDFYLVSFYFIKNY